MRERSIQFRDLFRAPTAITFGSLALLCHSCQRIDTVEGKIGVVAGKLGDVLDGYIARRFNMSSDAGALADAASDKIGMAVILAALWEHDIAPKPILAGMAVRNTVNTVATTYHGFNDPDKRAHQPPKSGKYAMAFDTLSIAAFMLADELQEGTPAYRRARTVGYGAATAGFVLGCDAARRYITNDFDVK